LPLLHIHRDFKLQNQSFLDHISLLSHAITVLPDSYTFLKNLFDESKTITVFTSGSTGRPKEIRIPKKSLLRSAEATQEFFKLPSKTRAIHCLSTEFIAGKMMWVRALHLGWHLDVVKPIAAPLEQTQVTYDFAAMVPLQVQNSLNDIYKLKKLIIGGAPISFALEQELNKQVCESYQTYGMTETITHIAAKRLRETDNNFYKCLPDIKVSKDERDCLQIIAPHVSEEIILTNDVVRLISATEFEWLGRFDNVINSGGIKLFPEQIESKLTTIISKSYFVSALPDNKLGQKLVLLIESEDEIPNLENLLANSDLSKYEVPKEMYYLKSFIRTKNSKINRNDTLSLINKEHL